MRKMLKTSALTALALGALTLAGSATARQDFVRNVETSDRACFDPSKMQGYAPTTVGVRDAVNVRVRGEGVFQLEFVGACPDIRQARGIVIQNKNTSRLLCTGGEAEVTVVGGFDNAVSCQISGMRKLTDTEIAALPAPARP